MLNWFFLEELGKVGFDVLNFSHTLDIDEARKRTGGRICLMGNVAPLEIGVLGTQEEVKSPTLDLLQKAGREGIILSLGGGVSPGMPGANIHAMAAAWQSSTHSEFVPRSRPTD